MRTGADVVLDILRDEGITHVFGNPGSTELGLVDAITRSPDLHYVLGLSEGCVVPMADAFAQAVGTTGFVNLHTMSGLGNAIGVLANVKANGTPLVVTAGQQQQALLSADPLLGYDLVALAAPVCKWAREVRSVEELGPLLRRAFADAAKAPAGPVFLSIPMDVVAAEAPAAPPRPRIAPAGIAPQIEEIARYLIYARSVALVVGQEAASAESIIALDRIARSLGAPVFAAFNTQIAPFPPAHPHAAGDLPATPEMIEEALAPHDVVLFAGSQLFQLFAGSRQPQLQGCAVLHLAPDPASLGRSYPIEFGTSGDVAASLAALVPLVAGLAPRAAPVRPAAPAAVETARDRLDAVTATRILCEALPSDAIIHNEAPCVGPRLRSLFEWTQAGQLFSSKQTIGWAMGAAIGTAIGHDRERLVLALVGDGSASFSLPALWSAAREDAPVIFAILDNQRYDILEVMAAHGGAPARNISPAFDLSRPAIDFVSIARGLGVDGERIGDIDGLRDAIDRAVAARRPYLLQIAIS